MNKILYMCLVSFLLSACDGLPIKNDTIPQTALAKLKKDNPNGLIFMKEEEISDLAKKTAAISSSALGKVDFGALESELNLQYSEFYKMMDLTIPYQPKVIVRAARDNEYRLMQNGDIVIDYSLLRNLTSKDQVATVLAHSAALVASGHRQMQQNKKLLSFSSQLLGIKSQTNSDTLGSLKEKAIGMVLDELSDGIEASTLKDADRLAMELLAIKGYDAKLLLEKLPGSIGNPILPTESLTSNEAKTTGIDVAVNKFVKEVFSSAKEKTIEPTATRYDVAQLSIQKMPLPTANQTTNSNYEAIFNSTETKGRFSALDKLFTIIETRKMKHNDVLALQHISPIAGLECATATAHAQTLFQFNHKDEAERLTKSYHPTCTTQSQTFAGLAIAFLDKAGKKQDAYKTAVLADEALDVPQFMIERIRLAKTENIMDMSSLRCSIEWGLASFDGVPVPNLCQQAEKGIATRWLSTYLH